MGLVPLVVLAAPAVGNRLSRIGRVTPHSHGMRTELVIRPERRPGHGRRRAPTPTPLATTRWIMMRSCAGRCLGGEES